MGSNLNTCNKKCCQITSGPIQAHGSSIELMKQIKPKLANIIH